MMTACWLHGRQRRADAQHLTVMGLLSSEVLEELRFFLLNKLSRLVLTAVLV